METIKNDSILEDILMCCKQLFDMDVTKAVPIHRGWLNLKWKVKTNSGNFLIKQFNKDRFRLYNEKELLYTFSQQKRLYDEGFPCPKLYPNCNRFLLESENGERFMVMEFCEGKLHAPGTVNEQQMFDLGKVTSKMHCLLNNGATRKKKKAEFIPPPPEKRLEHWRSVRKEVKAAGNLSLLPTIELQLSLTEKMSLTDFNLNETGWAHRDLFLDNILFAESHVSAILDFDRMKYDYPQLDVARAIMSATLLHHSLNLSLVQAFIEGYKVEQTIGKGFLTKALSLLWYMESTWWIEPNMEHHKGPPVRFAEEMIWLSENFLELESILGDL
ncbi:phosphotransferase [Sutcliffiella halmapala]|uniref:phosphotransferase n=1 Tax=Sutcliffiella halmapala TaxID=79882 RepID=UPI0009957513|nr:phosphotransferase [Sutcliffiella halmapala]